MRRNSWLAAVVWLFSLVGVNSVVFGQDKPQLVSSEALAQTKADFYCSLADQDCQRILQAADEAPIAKLFEKTYGELTAALAACGAGKYIKKQIIDNWCEAVRKWGEELPKPDRTKYDALSVKLRKHELQLRIEQAEDLERRAKIEARPETKVKYWYRAGKLREQKNETRKAAADYNHALAIQSQNGLGLFDDETLREMIGFIQEEANKTGVPDHEKGWWLGSIARTMEWQYISRRGDVKARGVAEAYEKVAECKERLYRDGKEPKVNSKQAYSKYRLAAKYYHEQYDQDKKEGKDEEDLRSKVPSMYRRAHELVQNDEEFKQNFADVAIKWAGLWLCGPVPAAEVAEAEKIIEALKNVEETNAQQARASDSTEAKEFKQISDPLRLRGKYEAYKAAISAQDLIIKLQNRVCIAGEDGAVVSERRRKQEELAGLEQRLKDLKCGSSNAQSKKKAPPKKGVAEKAKKIAALEKEVGVLRKELDELKKREKKLSEQREGLSKFEAELARLKAEQLELAADQKDADLSAALGSEEAAKLGNRQERYRKALLEYEDAAKKFEFIGDVESSRVCLEKVVDYSDSYLWSTSLGASWKQDFEHCREAAEVVVKKYQIEERRGGETVEDVGDKYQDFIDQFLEFFDEKINKNSEELLLEHYILAEKASRGDKNAGKYYIYLAAHLVDMIHEDVEKVEGVPEEARDEEYKRLDQRYAEVIERLKNVPLTVFESMPEKYGYLRGRCERIRSELLHKRLDVVHALAEREQNDERKLELLGKEIVIREDIENSPGYISRDLLKKGEVYVEKAKLQERLHKNIDAVVHDYEEAAKIYRECGLEERVLEIDKKELELWIGAMKKDQITIKEALEFIDKLKKDPDPRRAAYFTKHINLAAAEIYFDRGEILAARGSFTAAFPDGTNGEELTKEQEELERRIKSEELKEELLKGDLDPKVRLEKADDLKRLGSIERARDEYWSIYRSLREEYERIYGSSGKSKGKMGVPHDTKYYMDQIDLLLRQSEAYLNYVKCGGVSEPSVFNRLSQDSAAPLLWEGKYTSDYWRKMGRLKANIAAIGERCSDGSDGKEKLRIQEVRGKDAISKTYSHSWQAFCRAARGFHEEYGFIAKSGTEFKREYGRSDTHAVRMYLERYVEIMSEAERSLPDNYELSDEEEANYMRYAAQAAWNLAALLDEELDSEELPSELESTAWDAAGRLWLRVAMFDDYKHPEIGNADKAYLSTYFAYFNHYRRYWNLYKFITFGWDIFRQKCGNYSIEEK